MFYSVVRTIAKFILIPFYRIKVYGRENIPLDGRLVVCSNHASNWDPIFISIAFPRQISWMGKKELFKNDVIAYLLKKLTVFPVDRDGSDVGAIKNALKVLKAENTLGLFPEGTRVKSMDLNNAKSGVALLGYKSKAPILPIFIESNYKMFNRVNLYIGKPVDLHEMIEGRPSPDDYLDLSKKILYKIYDLKSMGEDS
ncbi:MAG: 1-acyl-sn-glycerol-3-phosphate acyltransferase [Tissierella sp.]|nr:1-acyl-sn-glycerol-3-phosphate acyltransferase [Tissierella sp.]